MVTKIISITSLSLFALISLGLNPVHASEVTGTLSAGFSQTNSDSSVDGSITGSVVSAGTLSGTVGSNSGSSSSGSRNGNGGSGGSVLGASTDSTSTQYPGLPNTGLSKDGAEELMRILAAILVLSIIPIRLLVYKKI